MLNERVKAKDCINTLLIDLSEMKIVKVASGKDAIRKLEQWAARLVPQKRFFIGGMHRRELARFSIIELKVIYRNTIDKSLSSGVYLEALNELHALGQSMEADATSLGELLKWVDKSATAEHDGPIRIAESQRARAQRPPPGTIAARIWNIADKINAEGNFDPTSKEFRDQFYAACAAENFCPETYRPHFVWWKKDIINS